MTVDLPFLPPFPLTDSDSSLHFTLGRISRNAKRRERTHVLTKSEFGFEFEG
jgi:hypothetical protein